MFWFDKTVFTRLVQKTVRFSQYQILQDRHTGGGQLWLFFKA